MESHQGSMVRTWHFPQNRSESWQFPCWMISLDVKYSWEATEGGCFGYGLHSVPNLAANRRLRCKTSRRNLVLHPMCRVWRQRLVQTGGFMVNPNMKQTSGFPSPTFCKSQIQKRQLNSSTDSASNFQTGLSLPQGFENEIRDVWEPPKITKMSDPFYGFPQTPIEWFDLNKLSLQDVLENGFIKRSPFHLNKLGTILDKLRVKPFHEIFFNINF